MTNSFDASPPASADPEVRFRVRYAETDQMGVAYHGGYFAWFELGRTELLRSRGATYADMERDGYRLVVTEAQAKYVSPGRYDEELRLHTRVADLGPARITFDYSITGPDGRRVALGRTTLACTDASGRVRRLPPEIVRRLRPDNKGPIAREDS